MCIEKVNYACSDSLTMVPLAESTTKLDLLCDSRSFFSSVTCKGSPNDLALNENLKMPCISKTEAQYLVAQVYAAKLERG